MKRIFLQVIESFRRSMIPRKLRLIQVLVLILFVLTSIIYGALIVCRQNTQGLYGIYYDNTIWQGEPYTISFDKDISTTTLKTKQAKLPQKRFSVEWTGYLNIPKTGIYTFSTSSDDGSWLYIDDSLVVDNDGAHGLHEAQGEIQLNRGLHRIKIRYLQIGENAGLDVSWAKDQNLKKNPLTAEFLLPPQISVVRFQIYQIMKGMFPFLLPLWCLLIIGVGIGRVTDTVRSFISMNIGSSQQLYQALFVFLIIVVLLQTYQQTWFNTLRSPPLIHNYGPAAGIAISEFQYGANQFMGYNKILNLFPTRRLLDNIGDAGPDFSIVNTAIQQALNLENVSSEGIYFVRPYEEKGLVIYYKLAFLLFGYKAESAFYLYWLFLGVSVLVFLISYFNRPTLLFFLLLFTCSLFAILQTQGIIYQSIIRNRFFPILAILPSFYLILIILGNYTRKWRFFIGTIVQALILSLINNIRPSSLYSLLFLFGTTIILLVVKRTKLSLFSYLRVQLLPLVIVLGFFTLIKVYTSNPVAHTQTGRNCTWHSLYLGLSAHPESKEKYGIFWGDMASVNVVRQLGYVVDQSYDYACAEGQKWQESESGEGDTIVWCSEAYEKILKDEFLKICRQDPYFVIKSYLYKFYQYLKIYFSSQDFTLSGTNFYYPFGVIEHLVEWVPMTALILGIFLIKEQFLQGWFLLLTLSMFAFSFSLSVPILYVPRNHTIADSALYFTIILLVVFAAVICFIIRFFEQRINMKKRQNTTRTNMVLRSIS